MRTKFEKENDELLKFLLEKRFFALWSEEEYDKKDNNFSSGAELEFYLTNTCNQKCSYCYLCDNDSLYPKECNNPETILKNLKIVCSWLLEKKFHIHKVHLFSGEIWHTNFGLEVLKVLYEYISMGLRFDTISIPTNGTFIQNKDSLINIQNYIYKFRDIGSKLYFSLSIDGAKVDTFNRPKKDLNVLESNYDAIFSFALENDYGFHPMIAAETIEQWEDNWNWWKEKCLQYGFNNIFQRVMMLEVRNDYWTEEKINSYCLFIETLFKDYVKLKYHNNIKKMTLNLLGSGNEGGEAMEPYIPCVLVESKTSPPCTIATSLTIRLGDLAICPCHRLAVDKNLYGKFVVEEDKIIDIQSNNVPMAIRIIMSNNKLSSPSCPDCEIVDYCLRGCFGSQYESNDDPFIPINSVCALLKAKTKTLLQLYEKYGVIDELKAIPVSSYFYKKAKNLLTLYEEIINVPKE